MGQKREATKYPGVYSYRDVAGDVWYGALVDIGDGITRTQKRKSGFRRARQAKQWRDEQIVKRARGEIATGGERTLSAWAEQWIAMRKGDWAPQGERAMRRCVRRLGVALLAMPLVKIGTAEVELALVAMRERYQANTIRQSRTVLSQLFTAATAMGLVYRNPVTGTTPPPRSKEGREFWDRAQVKAFLDAARGDEYEVLFHMLARTWMRIGEALALTWGDVDLGEGLVHIRRTVQVGGSGALQVGSTAKTRAAFRSLPLDPEMVRMLRHHRDRARLGGDWSAGAFVFARYDGRFAAPSRVRYHMRKICRAAGLADAGPHMLRHAGASIAARTKMRDKVISERLGHASVAFTMAQYVHPDGEDHKAAAEAFAALLDG